MERSQHISKLLQKNLIIITFVADNITNNNPINNTIGDLNKINLLNYLYSAFKQSFTNIKIKNTTTDEIEKIIKELKSHVDMMK
jgi:hypothetical protein